MRSDKITDEIAHYMYRKTKQYKRNVFSEPLHNFQDKTLWTTITVKLFDSMSNIVDISIHKALD